MRPVFSLVMWFARICTFSPLTSPWFTQVFSATVSVSAPFISPVSSFRMFLLSSARCPRERISLRLVIFPFTASERLLPASRRPVLVKSFSNRIPAFFPADTMPSPVILSVCMFIFPSAASVPSVLVNVCPALICWLPPLLMVPAALFMASPVSMDRLFPLSMACPALSSVFPA